MMTNALPLLLQVAAWLAMFAISAVLQAAKAENVYVIDTSKRPHSLAFANAINQACPSCQPVKYMDMHGSHRLARQIGSTLTDLHQKKELDLVVTIGRPATRLVARTLDDVPIFHSMAANPLPDSNESPNVINVEAVPPLSLQLQTLITLAPETRTIGFLGTRETLEPHLNIANKAAAQMGIQVKFYYVRRPYDVSNGLRKAIRETDGLIFLHDPVVVNADTVNYLLRLTLENRIPTLGYSEKLVERGMLAALTTNPEYFGKKLGEAIQQYIETGEEPSIEMIPALFQLHINGNTASQTPTVQAVAPNGVRMVLR